MKARAIACEGGFSQSIQTLYYKAQRSQGVEVPWNECGDAACGSFMQVCLICAMESTSQELTRGRNITCHMSWMLIDTCYEFSTHLECSWMQWCMSIRARDHPAHALRSDVACQTRCGQTGCGRQCRTKARPHPSYMALGGLLVTLSPGLDSSQARQEHCSDR